ncbi:hypothetical protein COO72_12555, partial [Bifidobacterium callitrichos]
MHATGRQRGGFFSQLDDPHRRQLIHIPGIPVRHADGDTTILSHMNGYNAVPQNGEVRDYVRNGLDAQATAKLSQCWELMSRFRTDRKVWFSLHTALELCRIERPQRSTLPNSSFYVTVKKGVFASLCGGLSCLGVVGAG